jgi:hypothetical protein
VNLQAAGEEPDTKGPCGARRPVLVPVLRPVLPASRHFRPLLWYGRCGMCADAKLESKALHAAARSSKPPLWKLAVPGPLPRRARHAFDIAPHQPLPGSLEHLVVCQPLVTRLSSLPLLPETVTRVETHLSHRKQTTAHVSTRDVPAHRFSCISGWRVGVTRRKCSCARRRAVCYSEGVPPSGKRASAPALPSQQWRPSPAHFIRSRRFLVRAPLAGAFGWRPLPGRLARGIGTQPGAQQPASPRKARKRFGVAAVHIGVLG